VRRVFIVK